VPARGDYEVVVAGGGLAGLTAGLTAARLGRSTLVLAGSVPGGLLLTIERIDGLPGSPGGIAGYELCPAVQEQAGAAGAEVAALELESLQPDDGGWAIATSDGDVRARTVVLATGARFKQLGVPGENRLRGRGVSTCASCDGPLVGGQTVAVVGGGDSALQEALTLAEHAGRVVVLHRGDELDGQASYRDQVAAHPSIDVRFGVEVKEILGDDRVKAVRLRGRAGGVEELEVAAVFPYVGLQPCSERAAGAVALDADGRIVTDEELRTGAPGVFAAGLVRSGAAGRAVATAGEGAAAAVAADAYLACALPAAALEGAA
jgi:thioredoxin reductase (NADPH)